MEAREERALIERAKEWDKGAWAEIYERRKQSIHRYVYYLVFIGASICHSEPLGGITVGFGLLEAQLGWIANWAWSIRTDVADTKATQETINKHLS